MASAAAALETVATAVFKALDVDEDGRVDVFEFLAFSKKLFEDDSPQDDMLQRTKEIMGLADRDGDERLNLKEWLQLMRAWDYPTKYDFLVACRAEALHRNSKSSSPNHTLLDFERRAIVREVFDTLDVNGTGTVDFTELTLLVETLHLKDVNVMMRQLDLDHDGVVSVKEWEQMMLNNKSIDHPKFFQQMRDYKRKIRAVRLDFLQDKAREMRAIDATLGPAEQVRVFLKNSGCGLSFAVSEQPGGRDGQSCMVTFSQPTPECPVPTTAVTAQFRFSMGGGLSHFTLEGESFPHSCTDEEAWDDGIVVAKLAFKAKMQGGMGDLSTGFIRSRHPGK